MRPLMRTSRGWRATEDSRGRHRGGRCKRPIVKQFHTRNIKFPLPHRIAKTPKEFKTTFKASRPTTFC